jgi:hypothetical protein
MSSSPAKGTRIDAQAFGLRGHRRRNQRCVADTRWRAQSDDEPGNLNHCQDKGKRT